MPCKAQVTLLKSLAKANAAAPWVLSERGTVFDHTSCGESAGNAAGRHVQRLDAF